MTFFDPWPVPLPVSQRVATPDSDSTEFPPSFGWDFEAGDVLTDGAGNVVTVTGDDAWQQWVRITVMTAQATYAAFHRDYGPDLATLRAEGEDAALLSLAQRIFSDALQADPRTASVLVTLVERDDDDLMRIQISATSQRGTRSSQEIDV